MRRLQPVFPILLALALALLIPGQAFAAPILKQGSEGHDVLVLQQNLKTLGYEVEPNGVFGDTTYRAVLAFQRDEKLEINGKVDRETWRALKKRASGKKAKPEEKKDASQKGVSPKETPPKDTPKNEPPAAKVPDSTPFLPKQKVGAILKTAKKYMGTRYIFGGTTPKGFDCSGFVQYVFKQNGFALPRAADEQYSLGKRVKKRAELEPGDLVFFSTYEQGASHCGIYLGKNQFIHVSSSKGVRVDNLDDSYWKPHWYGGKHIVKS
ncbi:MAG: C40 family peptidase [Schwartzia sp.]|nr:C40 family peptidase [Schwartzia sp. (in: firmicutes)]